MLLLQAYRSFAGNNDKPNLKIQIFKEDGGLNDRMIFERIDSKRGSI